MLVGHIGQRTDVGHIAQRVADGLDEYRLGPAVDQLAEAGRMERRRDRAVGEIGREPGEHGLGPLLVEARTGVDDADLHAEPLASSLARASQAAGHSPVSPS